MLSEDTLARLSQLNRQRLPEDGADGAGRESPTVELPLGDVGDEELSELPGGEEVTNVWGTHWIRRRSIRKVWPHGDQWLSHALVRLDQSRAKPLTLSRELRALLVNLPDRVIYLDLETCGFSGSMVFMVGLIHRRDGQFELAQLLARNYAEEKAMLQTLWTLVAENRVLTTFNGKSFDWPMVHDRSTLHHLGCDLRSIPNRVQSPRVTHKKVLSRHDPRPELIHCDLLHHARRRWKSKLPNCKLQTLERHICRRHRTDDIPGREIPSAYHDFVRSGDAWLIRSVLHHNALDLVTLLQLSMMLL